MLASGSRPNAGVSRSAKWPLSVRPTSGDHCPVVSSIDSGDDCAYEVAASGGRVGPGDARRQCAMFTAIRGLGTLPILGLAPTLDSVERKKCGLGVDSLF